MTDENQLRELQEAVDNWCPEQFDDEPFTSRVFRAFLNARACALDLKRVVDGEQPIRPLDSYPLATDSVK